MIKAVTGARDVKTKTESQLLKYERRKGLQTDNNYYINDSLTWVNYLQRVIDDKLQYMEVYDKNGYMLPPYDTGHCPAPIYRYINNICNFPQEPLRDSLLSVRMAMLSPFKATTTTSFNPSEYDYSIIIYYARFLGIMNKNYARTYEQLLRDQKDCKIQYIKVALDPVHLGER